MKYSIVVPVYNECMNIKPTTEAILKAFKNMGNHLEILYVDDNSPDGTASEVEQIASKFPQVKLVQHGKKEGMGAAYRAGYEAALGQFILGIDADLSQSPSDLVKMIVKLDNGFDMVIGSRYLPQAEMVGKSKLRDIGSRSMNMITRHVLGIPMTDATHTFRAFKREVFTSVADRINEKGHPSFQIQFTYWANRQGFRISEIPIRFEERSEGRGISKLSIKKELMPFAKLVCKLTAQRVSLLKKSDIGNSLE